MMRGKSLGDHLRDMATEEYQDPVTDETKKCIPPGVLYATHPQLVVPEAHAIAEKRSFVPPPDNLHGTFYSRRAIELKRELEALDPARGEIKLRHGRELPSGMDWYGDIKKDPNYHCTQMEDDVRSLWTKGGINSALHYLCHGKHIVNECQGIEQWLPSALDETQTQPASVTYVDIVRENNINALANLKKSQFAPADCVGLTGDCLDKATYGKRLDQLNASPEGIVVMVWGNTPQDFHIPTFLKFQVEAYKKSTTFIWSMDHTTDQPSLESSYGKSPVIHLVLNAVAQHLWFVKKAQFSLSDLGAGVYVTGSDEKAFVNLCVYDKRDPEGTRQIVRPITKISDMAYSMAAYDAGHRILHRTRTSNFHLNTHGNSLANGLFDYNITVSCHRDWSGAEAFRQRLRDFRI